MDRPDPLNVSDARAAILATISPGAAGEACPLGAARGRVLSAAVTSGVDLPPFDNSAMDGFAVRAADTSTATVERPVRLRVMGESRAGVPADEALVAGGAMRISTGAAMPRGADAVVRVEDTALDGGEVLIAAPVTAGHDVRPRGDDVHVGDLIVPAGRRLAPGDCAAIAAAGGDEVQVHPRPRVAIVGTGDELAAPGSPLQPGQIHDSNVPMLEHLAAASGALVTLTRARVADTRAATETAIADALDAADIVIIAGGVSMGEHDHVKPALDACGVREVFWRVALRPGHPTWFGLRDRPGRPAQLVFGLPGNPASAFVTFHLFVAPALAAWEGEKREPVLLPAIYRGAPITKPAGMTLALRCAVHTDGGELVAETSAGNQRSHSVRSLVGVDGLMMVPPDATEVQEGDAVTVAPIGW